MIELHITRRQVKTAKEWPWLGLVALVTASSTAVWAQNAPYGGGYYGHDMMWSGGGYGMVFAPVFMLIVLGAAILIIATSIRWLFGLGSHHLRHKNAVRHHPVIDILKERYARGEIDREEFEEKKRHLSE